MTTSTDHHSRCKQTSLSKAVIFRYFKPKGILYVPEKSHRAKLGVGGWGDHTGSQPRLKCHGNGRSEARSTLDTERGLQAPLPVHTLRLFTHLKEYLHFFDFHFPFPQLFLPGALGVFVGVSGRSVFVPLSILTASSCAQ